MLTPKPQDRTTGVFGKLLAAAVLLGTSLGAVAALQPWRAPRGASAPVPADDAVADGLKIVEPPVVNAATVRLPAPSARDPQLETQVRNWTYTGVRGGPSPGH